MIPLINKPKQKPQMQNPQAMPTGIKPPTTGGGLPPALQQGARPMANPVNAASGAIGVKGSPLPMPQNTNPLNVQGGIKSGVINGMAQKPGQVGLPPAPPAGGQVKQQSYTDMTGNVAPSDDSPTGNSLSDIEQAYADATKTSQKGLGEELRNVDFMTSLMSRRSAEENAAMGGGLGGAAQSGQMQAGLSGMQERNRAISANFKQQLAVKMDWLNQLRGSDEAKQNRELQKWIQEEENKLRQQQLDINKGIADAANQTPAVSFKEESQNIGSVGEFDAWVSGKLDANPNMSVQQLEELFSTINEWNNDHNAGGAEGVNAFEHQLQRIQAMIDAQKGQANG